MTANDQSSASESSHMTKTTDSESELKSKIQKRVALEEKAFRIVERFLDNPVSQTELLKAAASIDKSHYEDIVEERSIGLSCGYPLCCSILTNVSKKKYHICTKSNKLFDITERKKYCCSQCYKASSFFLTQLSSTPVWLRGEEWEEPSITLLPHHPSLKTAATEMNHDKEMTSRSGMDTEISPTQTQTESVPAVRPGNPQCAEGENEHTGPDRAEVKEAVTNDDALLGDALLSDPVLILRQKSPVVLRIAQQMRDLSLVTEETDTTCVRQTPAVHSPPHHTRSALRQTSSDVEGERPVLKKTVSICDQPVLLGPVSDTDVMDAPSDLSKRCVEDAVVVDGQSVTERLTQRVEGRRQSLKEPQTPDVYMQGEATAQQAVASFRFHRGSVGEVSDVTSVRDVLLKEEVELDSDDEASPQTYERPVVTRKKSISDAVTLVNQISTTSRPNGQVPRDKVSAKPPLIRSASISDAVEIVSRKQAPCSSSIVGGMTSLKDRLKSEIRHMESSEQVTDKLIQRVQDRRKSLSEPPMPDVYTAGGGTTKDAALVMKKKGSSVDEMHSSLDKAIGRINKYKAILDDDGFKVKQVGETHPEDVKDHKQSKSVLMNDLLDKRQQLDNGTFPAETGKNYEMLDCSYPVSETSTDVDGSDVSSCRRGSSSSSSYMRFIEDVPLVLTNSMQPPSQVEADAQKVRRLSSNYVPTHSVKQPSPRQDARSSISSKSSKKHKTKPKLCPQALIKNTLFQWKTMASVKFLISDKGNPLSCTKGEVKSHDFQRKYAELCQRVDASQGDLSDVIGDISEDSQAKKAMPDFSRLQQDSEKFSKKVREYYGVQKPAKEMSNGEKTEEDKEIILPCIDSHSQMSMRRKIVLDKLNTSLNQLLEPLHITLRDVSLDIRQLVSTFKFTSTTIILRPAEWTLVSFIILKLLSYRNSILQKAFSHHYASHYFITLGLSIGMTESRIHDIIDHMTSLEGL